MYSIICGLFVGSFEIWFDVVSVFGFKVSLIVVCVVLLSGNFRIIYLSVSARIVSSIFFS